MVENDKERFVASGNPQRGCKQKTVGPASCFVYVSSITLSQVSYKKHLVLMLKIIVVKHDISFRRKCEMYHSLIQLGNHRCLDMTPLTTWWRCLSILMEED